MLHLLLLSPAYALPDFDSAPTWEAYGDGTSARLGSVVLGVGDVNGDGYDDIAISRMEGGVHIHVHHGTAVGPYYDSAWDLALGYVAGWGMYEVNPPIASGDFNGDGYGDLVVGIPDGSSLNNATVYFGSPSGLSVNAGWQHFGGSGEGYGSCVAALNANNDAFSDLVVCAAQKAVTYTNEGECSLYLGSTVGPSGTAATTLVGNLSGGRFGSACGRAGDVNGDGYEDLLVSAPSAGSGAANGRFYVYHGRSTGLRTTASRSYGAEYGGGGMWSSAVGIGDVNGDGYDDIASGMPWAENGTNSEGRVWVFH
ncbi:MAG TPA: FG-GAP-like repeat-containing protein, partial [Myxococcota bacterium]|nr:FG-GAP-like repeat-containing protein [Myxococcota bacterium]